jgi:hypothetical protein
MAYYSAISNPFLQLDTLSDAANDHSPYLLVGATKWKRFRQSVDEISRAVGNTSSITTNT